MKSKNKKALKQGFSKFMTVFIIILLLTGILLPAIVVVIDVLMN